ncbi:MAG: ABC transporter ATP-binding protein [Pseudomonadota bacterium]
MTAAMITLANLRFRWQAAGPDILDIADFNVAAGKRVFLRGPSGSGKTTLLNLLGGVATPQTGKVQVMGTDLTGLSSANRDAFRADHIGFIFQLFNLVPYLGLIENVTLPCRFSRTRRNRATRSGTLEVEAERLLTQMHLDVPALRTRPVAELSVGQQQRVAAARALIGAPELIIADEPTSSIDADARDAFLDLLFTEVDAAKSTLLFVSHDAGLEPRFETTVHLPEINRAA